MLHSSFHFQHGKSCFHLSQTLRHLVLEATFSIKSILHRICVYMASSPTDIPSSCTTPTVFFHDLPTPGPQPDRVFLSIFVDIRDIVLTRGNPTSTSLYGLERVPVFTCRSLETLQQLCVDDVKQKISTYIWDHVHLDIRTSDFVLLVNPSLITQHRRTPGLVKLNYNLTWYEVLHQIDLPLNTPTIMLETCTTSQWKWIQDHHISSTPRLLRPGCIPGLYA